MKYKYDGINIVYDKIGKGDPLILLHGWGCDRKIFSHLVSNLLDHFTIYTIDLPGFGDSDEPLKPYKLDDYVNLLTNFIIQNNIISPIILGHSFGGRIAIRYTSKTNITNKLILVDSAGIKPKNYFLVKLKIFKYKTKKKWLKLTKNVNAYLKLINSSGSNDYQNATPIMKQTLSKITKEHLEKDLKQIKTNTLIIWGKYDNTTPISDGKRINKLLVNSGLVVLNAGHFPHLEKPNQFLSIVKSYLGVE